MRCGNLKMIEGDSRFVNLKLDEVGDFPANPEVGEICYRSDRKIAYTYDGASWHPITAFRKLWHVDIGALSGTTQIPYDNSVPSITEGTQIWSQAVTPTDIDSKYLIDLTFTQDVSSNNRGIIFSLFRDSTCIAAVIGWQNNSNRPMTTKLIRVVNAINSPNPPQPLVPVTFSVRCGLAGGGGTWYVNRGSGATLGGLMGHTSIS